MILFFINSTLNDEKEEIMARPLRLKVKGEDSYYHIISRTVGQIFYFGDMEKEKFVKILEHYSRIYFIKIIGFCVMSNHVHLVLKVEPGHCFDDNEVKRRVEKYLNKRTDILGAPVVDEYRKKLEDISEFMRSVKQTFSRWFNKIHNRTGYLWGDRFKSVWIESGESLMTCLAYVELNPLRAGLVQRPEDYRWSSFGYRLGRGGNKRFLSFDGIFDEEKMAQKEMLANYRYLVYKSGKVRRASPTDLDEGTIEDVSTVISDKVYDEELKRHFILPGPEVMLKRLRYFSDGMVIGTKEFIQAAYIRFGGNIIKKKERRVHQTVMGKGMFSLRQLRNTS